MSISAPISATSNITPRLSSSLTWTELPADFLKRVQTVFNQQFDIEAQTGEFVVEGRIYPDEVILRLGYLEQGRLKQINFEASMALPKRETSDASAKDSTMENLYSCIDALGSLMEEYFDVDQNEEEMDVPLHWRAYEFEGEKVYLQYSTVNSRLEAEADRILGLAAAELVKEAARSEDALANAEIDSELAFEVQQVIREGKHPLQQTHVESGSNSDDNLN